jgi:hypothetical protein
MFVSGTDLLPLKQDRKSANNQIFKIFFDSVDALEVISQA